MTPRERAEDLIRRFDEPVRDRGNHRVQAMINMAEEAIIAAIKGERERCAKIVQEAAEWQDQNFQFSCARALEDAEEKIRQKEGPSD